MDGILEKFLVGIVVIIAVLALFPTLWASTKTASTAAHIPSGAAALVLLIGFIAIAALIILVVRNLLKK